VNARDEDPPPSGPYSLPFIIALFTLNGFLSLASSRIAASVEVLRRLEEVLGAIVLELQNGLMAAWHLRKDENVGLIWETEREKFLVWILYTGVTYDVGYGEKGKAIGGGSQNNIAVDE
jgi:hypothetical protein